MTIKLEPLQSALGARVHGVDLAAPVAPATRDAIHAAWMYAVLEALPPALATRIEGRRARHDFG